MYAEAYGVITAPQSGIYSDTPPQQSAHQNRATKRSSGIGILTPPWLGCNCITGMQKPSVLGDG